MNKTIEFKHISAVYYDTVEFQGQLTVVSMVSLNPLLNKYINPSNAKNLAVDLSGVDALDSSGLRLLINLDKKTKASGKQFYLLRPSSPVLSVLTETNLNSVFTILDSSATLEKQITATIYDTYLPYTYEEAGLKRLRCSCPACGSTTVAGYVINQNDFQWRWQNDDPFPTAFGKENDTSFDVFSLLPMVCHECFMSSIRISDFNVLNENNTIAIKTSLDDQSKNLLTKAIKKRKKMMEINRTIGDTFFMFPRDQFAAYKAYELAENCLRTISVVKAQVSFFEIGYLNYLTIRYAEMQQKDSFINNCRAWFTETLKTEFELPLFERAVSYFVLMIADLNLNKKNEAAAIHQKFTDMVNSLKSESLTEGYANPQFWLKQADLLWKREIESQSQSMKL